MPPKRKAAAAKGASGGKKARKGKAAAAEPEASTSDAPATVSDAILKLKTADKGKIRKCKPDTNCPLQLGVTVHEDYDCMLNQTNIGHNNNKYYIIQVLYCGGTYYSWNRWGRVGETGANSLKAHGKSVDNAIKDFKKKFRDKTQNAWDNRSDFTPVAKKYTLLEMDDEEGDIEETKVKLSKLDEVDGVKKVIAPSTLDKPTQDLVKLLFDNDMFRDAMKDMEIDVKKMPLGKLSKSQIAKGFEALEEIETKLKKKTKGVSLDSLTSRFYTMIPHAFGRQRPPLIQTEEQVRKKMDMLMVLADIELAQAMQKTKQPSISEDTTTVPNPLDENYDLLQSDLDYIEKNSSEYKIIDKYVQTTGSSYNKPKILDVWKVSRHMEDKRFVVHDKLDNRKLLWHGTNVAVVAAILKSGLRIMPHSGGRVGRGIYFASENAKSAGYVSCASGGIGIMFLNEVVLGKEKHITIDDWSLTKPPAGYDCIIAKGLTEPDPKADTTLTLDGHKVTVPQGKPLPTSFKDSHFSQSEYLIYKESQNRIRYMLKMKLY